MFNAGIEVIYDQIQTKFENDCVQAVQHYGFNIDKDRLQKALTESRSFYDEGYADAKKEFERLPGEWIDNGQGFHFCKSCGYFALYQTHDTKTYFEKLSDCCPHCGAKMKEVDNG